jgi:hypothetical protein
MKQGLPRRTAERSEENSVKTASGGALPSGVPRQQRIRSGHRAYRQLRTPEVYRTAFDQ